MKTIYRLSSFHPNRYGFNEAPHKSMKALNTSKDEMKAKGFTEFKIDIYKVTG